MDEDLSSKKDVLGSICKEGQDLRGKRDRMGLGRQGKWTRNGATAKVNERE